MTIQALHYGGPLHCDIIEMDSAVESFEVPVGIGAVTYRRVGCLRGPQVWLYTAIKTRLDIAVAWAEDWARTGEFGPEVPARFRRVPCPPD